MAIVPVEARKFQVEERIRYRNSSTTLENIIVDGTSCSNFEAQIITEKAKEVFQIGEYNIDAPLEAGQMIWKAISAKEPPGKPLEKCKFKRIVLSVHVLEDDRPVKIKYDMSAKRQQQILRMTSQAEDQGTFLTVEDLATILDCNEKTIRRDIKKLESMMKIKVPTRGNKCDIGPGITHREKVLELFIKGSDALQISRQIKHSLKAVERYISSFCRIVYCQQQVKNSLKTALITGFSSNLVSRCMKLKNCFKNTSDYKKRIEQIEEIGTRFWKTQDSKKKPGQIKRSVK